MVLYDAVLSCKHPLEHRDAHCRVFLRKLVTYLGYKIYVSMDYFTDPIFHSRPCGFSPVTPDAVNKC